MAKNDMAPSSSSSSPNGVRTRSKTAATPSSKNDVKNSIKVKKTSAAKSKKTPPFDVVGTILLFLLIGLTVITYPGTQITRVTWQHVWYYGWLSAISTGLGAIPFYFFTEPNKFWMGVSNAIAGGMMLAASYSLAYEGATFTEATGLTVSPTVAVAIGFGSGIAFILVTKQILDQFEGLKTEIDGASIQKMVLIMFVMTLHSITEGIGIGVSFGGKSGMQLGQFISMSLAVHNVPEGLAVALVMTSRKVSQLRAALWAVFTSLPQPLMAVPAFIFVERFIVMLPSGLGFAAGAMAYVAGMA